MKKAKRILLPLILALLLVAVAVFTTACSGNDSPDKNYSPASDFAWEIVDGKVNITGYTGNDKEVVIPPVINGAQVTSIGDYAFCPDINLTSITIHEGVTSIGDYAFASCVNLASIKLPYTVTSIGDFAFYDCRCLMSIKLPNSITSIGAGAFSGCSNLASITIPDSVTSIGVYAFFYCTNLVGIIVDENNSNYRSIDGNLYSKDGKILVAYAVGKQETSLIIPEGVTSIGDYAFFGCTNLTGIIVDKNNPNYRSIDGNLYSKDGKILVAYAAGKQELSFIIPEGVTSIGSYAFSLCDNFTSITIPDSVTSIGEAAFYGCTGLTNITIPESVTSIGDCAFSYCDNLTSIDIPEGVTSIGDYAFYSCENLTIHCEATTQPEGWEDGWNSSECPVVWGYEAKE